MSPPASQRRVVPVSSFGPDCKIASRGSNQRPGPFGARPRPLHAADCELDILTARKASRHVLIALGAHVDVCRWEGTGLLLRKRLPTARPRRAPHSGAPLQAGPAKPATKSAAFPATFP